MEHPARNFHHELSITTQKARPGAKAEPLICYLRRSPGSIRTEAALFVGTFS
jgi:hypothetical protein